MSIGRRYWAITVEAYGEDREKGRAPPKEGAEDKITNTCLKYFNSIILCLIYLSFRPLFKILLQSSVCRSTTQQVNSASTQPTCSVCLMSSASISAMTGIDGQGLVADTMINHRGVSHNAGLVSLLQLLNAG